MRVAARLVGLAVELKWLRHRCSPLRLDIVRLVELSPVRDWGLAFFLCCCHSPVGSVRKKEPGVALPIGGVLPEGSGFQVADRFREPQEVVPRFEAGHRPG